MNVDIRKNYRRIFILLCWAALFAHSSRQIYAQGSTTQQGLRFVHPSAPANSITLNPPSSITSYTLTLPTAAGSNGQVLQTDGSGNMSWTTPTSGTVTGSGTATQIAYWSGSSALTGSSTLYWDNTNTRIGIGTNSPQSEIHVNRGTGLASYLQFTAGTTTGTTTTDGFEVGITSAGNAEIRQQENLPMLFYTNNTERMRILSSGSIGIGTTAPTTTLHVNGSGRISGGSLTIDTSAASTAGTLILYNPARTFTTSLRAGAQTANLTYTLPTAAPTAGQVLSSDASGNMSWTTPTSGTVTGSGTATQVAYWSGSSALTSSSNLYWDNTNTRLGIGTSSPTTTLHINGSGRIAGGSLTIDTSAASTAGTLIFYNPARTFTTSFRAGANSGNVTYTLPTADGSSGQVLQTNGSGTLSWITAATSSTAWMRAGNSSTTVGTDFLGTTDANAFMIKTNGTERLRVANGTTITLGVQGTGATAPPSTFTFGSAGYTAASSSSNQTGSDLVIQSGPGTGSSTTAGDIIFQTPTAGASGTTVQSLTERMRIQNSNAITVGINGSGATAPPSSFSFGSAGYTAASSSSNQAGTDLILQGGPGTGNSTSAGNIIFRTPSAGASGTSVQSQSEVMRLTTTNRVGIGTTSPGQLVETMNGNMLLNNNNNTAAELRFAEPSTSGSHYTAFKAQTQSANVTYTLPSADGTSGAFLTTNGSGGLSWVSMGTSYFAYKTVDESIANNNTTLQDEDDLGVTIAANEVWEVDYMLRVTGSSGDIKFAVVAPTGASMWLAAIGDAYGSNDDFVEVNSSGTAYVFDSSNFSVSNSGTVIQIKGLVVNSSTAGTIKVQFCQRYSNASATSVKAMSYVRAVRLQ